MQNQSTSQVSDEIQVTIRGLPSSLSPENQQEIAHCLFRNTLPGLPNRGYAQGETIYQGQAHLRIQEKTCPIVFSIDAVRVIAALQVYKEAFDKVHAGAREGIYDWELAEVTADYLKQSAWEEVQAVVHPKNHQQISIVRQEVGGNMEVEIQGIPTSLLTPLTQAEAIVAVIREILQPGAKNFPKEIIGKSQTTRLQIGGAYYPISYVFRSGKN